MTKIGDFHAVKDDVELDQPEKQYLEQLSLKPLYWLHSAISILVLM